MKPSTYWIKVVRTPKFSSLIMDDQKSESLNMRAQFAPPTKSSPDLETFQLDMLTRIEKSSGKMMMAISSRRPGNRNRRL